MAASPFHMLSRCQIEVMVAERHGREAPDVRKKNSKDPTINLMIPHKKGPNYMVKWGSIPLTHSAYLPDPEPRRLGAYSEWQLPPHSGGGSGVIL